MNRVIWTVIGFVLLLTGFLSLILGFIGLSLKPLLYLDTHFNPLTSVIIKLAMMIGGFLIFYRSRIQPEEE